MAAELCLVVGGQGSSIDQRKCSHRAARRARAGVDLGSLGCNPCALSCPPPSLPVRRTPSPAALRSPSCPAPLSPPEPSRPRFCVNWIVLGCGRILRALKDEADPPRDGGRVCGCPRRSPPPDPAGPPLRCGPGVSGGRWSGVAVCLDARSPSVRAGLVVGRRQPAAGDRRRRRWWWRRRRAASCRGAPDRRPPRRRVPEGQGGRAAGGAGRAAPDRPHRHCDAVGGVGDGHARPHR